MKYTFNLDLSVYQVGALYEALTLEVGRAARNGHEDAAFPTAADEISKQVRAYLYPRVDNTIRFTLTDYQASVLQKVLFREVEDADRDGRSGPYPAAILDLSNLIADLRRAADQDEDAARTPNFGKGN